MIHPRGANEYSRILKNHILQSLVSRSVYFILYHFRRHFVGQKTWQALKNVVQKFHHRPKKHRMLQVQKLQRGQLVRVRIIDLNQEEGKLQVSMLQPMPVPGKKDALFFVGKLLKVQRWPRRGHVSLC